MNKKNESPANIGKGSIKNHSNIRKTTENLGLNHEEFLQKCKHILDSGISIIPTKPDKSPAIKSWGEYQSRRMNESEFQEYFSKPNIKAVGAIAGKVSGNLEVIDVDLKNDKVGTLEENLKNAINEVDPELWQKLVIASTQNKGLHLFYRCESIQGSQKLASGNNGVLIETKGEGGYVLIEPSPGYKFIQSNLDCIPNITLEERSILLKLCKSFNESGISFSNQEMDGTTIYPRGEHDNICFEYYDIEVDPMQVVEQLIRHGWSKVNKDTKNEIRLKRPGKVENGISASYYLQANLFKVYSPSTEFKQDRLYNPYEIYTILECGGDYDLALVCLSKQEPLKTFIDEIEASQNDSIFTRSFPIDGFPESIQKWVNHCHKVFKTPLDYWAGSALLVTALVAGKKFELQTKYKNYPTLWICIVGDVSTGKSEPLKLMLEPIYKMDTIEYDFYKSELEEYERQSKLTRKQLKEENIEKINKPVFRQHIVKDYTPESLAPIIEGNPNGVLVHRDELKGWIDDLNRYNKSGELSNLLGTFTRDPFVINRKEAGVTRISDPNILIGGGMQPALLPKLAEDDRGENGFMARMCFLFPEKIETPKYTIEEVDPTLKDEWKRFIMNLIKISTPGVFTLSEEAHHIYEDWFNKNAEQKSDPKIPGYLKGVYGKLDIIVLRVALILKAMWYITDCESDLTISAKLMRHAIDITEYFRFTGEKVYRKIYTKSDNGIPDKNSVIWYLFKNKLASNSEIARILNTSRTQIKRVIKRYTHGTH